MKRISGPGAAHADYALVTAADVRAYLGNVSSTENATELAAILENVHRRFAEELGGRILKDTGTAYDYVLDSTSSDTLYLPHYPIVSISLLEWVEFEGGGTYRTIQSYASTDYETDLASGTIYGVNRWFPTGKNTMRCTWRAGFAVVPADVRDAVCQWAATVYNRVFGGRLDKVSEAHEADSVSYSPLDRPASMQAAINRWKYLEATLV